MEEQREFTNQDMTNAVYIFSTALAHIFQDRQGIIIPVVDERIQLPEESNSLLVYKMDEKIHIQKYEGDLEMGTVVNLRENEEE